ncbi:MAG: tail fiber domain-containing protein, partial [Gammaproteobacteria bacterium]|nr:tail fiber domain-containing protein [Gammaproteobacteria bacterium]
SGDIVRFDNSGTSSILLLDTLNNEGFRLVTNKDSGAFSIEDMGTAVSGAGSERMRIDASGNVGIGCSPSPWAFSKALQLGDGASLATGGNQNMWLSSNLYLGTDANFKYVTSRNASQINLYNGGVTFHRAATGTADATATLQESMRIDSSGRVGIGTSSPSQSWTGGSAHVVQIEGGGSQITALRINESNDANGDLQLISSTNNEVGIYNFNNGAMRFGTNGSEAMRIDSSGNITFGKYAACPTNGGIDSPELHLVGSGWNTAVGSRELGAKIVCKHTYGSGGTGQTDARLEFKLNQSDSTSYTTKLAVKGDGSLLLGSAITNGSGGVGYSVVNSSGLPYVISNTSVSSRIHQYFRYNGGNVGTISTTTTATAYNTSSDYRLKEDWQPIANASDRLMQLKPCNFAWKADGSRVDGFLAHEAQEVVPESVTGTKDAMTTEEYEVTPAVYEDAVIPAVDEVLDEDGNVITEAQEERTEQNLVSEAVMGEREVEDYQGIDQSKLVPLLTAALQDALTKIDDLEMRIAALENK